MSTDFPRLFSPLQIAGTTLKNRIVMLPHGTSMVADGAPTDDDIAYETRRPASEPGLMITGASVTSLDSTRRRRKLIETYNDAALPALAHRADPAVHRAEPGLPRVRVAPALRGQSLGGARTGCPLRRGSRRDDPAQRRRDRLRSGGHGGGAHRRRARPCRDTVRDKRKPRRAVPLCRRSARSRRTHADRRPSRQRDATPWRHGQARPTCLQCTRSRCRNGHGDLRGRGTARPARPVPRDAVECDAAAIPAESLGPLLVRLGGGAAHNPPPRMLLGAADGRARLADIASGAKSTVPCDLLVVQTGREPVEIEAARFTAAGLPVHRIGDCVAPRRISNALLEARLLAGTL